MKNRIVLVGAVTRDAELKYTTGGLAICEMTVAGDSVIAGTDKTATWYHKVNAFGKQAEVLAELKAGQAIAVDGSLVQNSWTTADGKKRSSIQIRVNRLEVLVRPESDFLTDSSGGFRLKGGRNEVSVIGNIGKEPVLRHTSSGDAVLDISIAVTEKWQDSRDEWKEKTSWVDVVLWRELAQGVANLLKGTPIMVQGRLKSETWTDDEGNKRFTTKVEAQDVEVVAKPFSAKPPVTRAASGSPSDEGTDTSAEMLEDLPF